MRKATIRSLTLFFLSVIVNNLHRGWQSNTPIHPFFIGDTAISIGWYTKMLCEMLSFSLLMLCVCAILKPVEKHFETVQWVGHNALFIFVKVWHRIFWVVVVISGLDIFHFLLSFRQTEWFFLIQNGVFFLMTSYYLYKAYRR